MTIDNVVESSKYLSVSIKNKSVFLYLNFFDGINVLLKGITKT